MKKEGSLFGGILLVSGSCIGAGMLALPVITGVAGFFPSMLMFLLAWLFMMVTGFFVLEVNLALGYRFSLLSLAQKTLGSFGKGVCWVLFLFLFYSLSVAYICASGLILHAVFGMPAWCGSVLFSTLFGVVLYFGVKPVDYLNRLLMLALIASYFILVFLGSSHIHFDYLSFHEWKYAFAAMPILIISFGFHNMIPSLAMYMKGNVKRLKKTLLIGSLIPLILYFIWEVVMLGILPPGEVVEALDHGEAATSALQSVVGKGWINTVAQLFALFAIITSFLAQSLSLVDFLSDGLKIAKVGLGRLALIAMAILPPFIFAFLNPGIFIRALSMGGGLSAVILFGVMPALMVYILRKKNGEESLSLRPTHPLLLVAVLVVAFGVFFIEIAGELGLRFISHA
ncbi:MAG: Tyrosine-specific transport protein [Chlamydiales bacterium]|nr:Tyrosine-specific transport protein [Chlamydiales bacterium]MCH9619584.1 Tyrosine-specific transport protein [Chlamydiales bacterium]MCH9623190.1 Tyrosine-specific transport protein [Chlamydiales bacterium]